MRKFAGLMLVSVALMLAACGGGSSSPAANATTPPAPTATTAPAATATTASTAAATITFGKFSFSGNTSVTIKAGQAVLFDDPSTGGGVHNLVIGHGGQFSAMSGAPTEFNSASGASFAPGDQKSVVFASAGTFPITCTIHPSMQVTVTVTA